MKKRMLLGRPAVFPAQELYLKNKKDGREKSFLLRPYKPGDEEGIIACIRAEYGDTYFKRDFYIREKLAEKATGQHYQFFVAVCENEIVGMLIFTFFTPSEDCLEPASEILNPKIRGMGLAEKFVEYTFPLAKSLLPGCLLVHAVTFHSITQKICLEQGMIPVGFRFGTFLAEKSQNSYQTEGCIKHSEGIMILPVRRKNAGNVYLPEEISGFCKKRYEQMGIGYKLFTEKSTGYPKEVSDKGEKEKVVLSVTLDEDNRNCLLVPKNHGKDMAEQIKAQMDCHKEPHWAYQVTLTADSPEVFEEYVQLKELGFFFSGLKPVCSNREQFFMQWCEDLDLSIPHYKLTSEFEALQKELEPFYLARKKT